MFSRIISGHKQQQSIGITILYAYISIPRHIRKGVLIRRIIASHLCTGVGDQQFCKKLRKLQNRFMFKRYSQLANRR